jgi:hypothetical protein
MVLGTLEILYDDELTQRDARRLASLGITPCRGAHTQRAAFSARS